MKHWVRTETILGHLPDFEITCEFCAEPMLLRYSQIILEPIIPKRTWYRKLSSWVIKKFNMSVIPTGVGKPINNTVEYKCSLCGNVNEFRVEDDSDYLLWVLNKRGGIPLYYPPKETWAEENERIREKLETLGYM